MRYLPLILLTGCTQLVQIDYSIRPPDDWPKLRERVVYADLASTHAYCRTPNHLRRSVKGCATVDFRNGICNIYLSKDDPEMLKHERAHCAGYDHVGEGYTSHRSLERWKEHVKRGGV